MTVYWSFSWCRIGRMRVLLTPMTLPSSSCSSLSPGASRLSTVAVASAMLRWIAPLVRGPGRGSHRFALIVDEHGARVLHVAATPSRA